VGLYDAADEFLVPLRRVPGGAWPGADQPARGARLSVAGAPVSALVRDGDVLLVRVFNPGRDPVTATVHLDGAAARGEVVDLVGTIVAPFAGAIDVPAGAIRTLRVGPEGVG
jgi:hypothetical protein